MAILSTTEREHLRKLQKRERGSDLYIRITVLLMLDSDFSVSDIELSLGLDQTTINRYLVKYQTEGLDTYLTLNYVGYSGKLTQSEETILDTELQSALYISTYEIIDFIKSKFNKTYTPSGLSKLLARLDFVYKKTKQELCKADTEKQRDFLAHLLETLSEVGINPTESVAYFVDGVHPQHNTRPDYGWIKKGQEFTIPANTGRKRVNINGALNPHDVTDVVIDEAETINQESMKRLIIKLVDKHPTKQISLIHDNAPYYFAKELREWIAEKYPSVKQIFLPPYSPNLNLIERLWKFMKKQIINYEFYPTFKEFKDNLLKFFENINQYKKELESLLTLKFHVA